MDTSFLTEYLTIKYGNQHKIIKGITYQLSTLDNFEIGIYKLIRTIEDYFLKEKNSKYSLNYIITGIIYIYNSVKIIYDFPYLLDNPKNKGHSSLHILYNEAVAQLISLVFLTESLNLWNYHKNKFQLSEEITKHISVDTYDVLVNDSFSISDNITKLLSSSVPNKNLLISEFKDIQQKFIKQAINLSIIFYRHTLSLDENDIEKFESYIKSHLTQYL